MLIKGWNAQVPVFAKVFERLPNTLGLGYMMGVPVLFAWQADKKAHKNQCVAGLLYCQTYFWRPIEQVLDFIGKNQGLSQGPVVTPKGVGDNNGPPSRPDPVGRRYHDNR